MYLLVASFYAPSRAHWCNFIACAKACPQNSSARRAPYPFAKIVGNSSSAKIALYPQFPARIAGEEGSRHCAESADRALMSRRNLSAFRSAEHNKRPRARMFRELTVPTWFSFAQEALTRMRSRHGWQCSGARDFAATIRIVSTAYRYHRNGCWR